MVLGNLVPAAIDLVAAALEALGVVIETAKPVFEWLWENFIKPIGEWVADRIIEAIKGVTSVFTKFSDWARNNKEAMDLIYASIATLLGYMVYMYAIKKVTTIISAITLAIIYIGSNWSKLNGIQKLVTVFSGIATAALVAAYAVSAFHISWTLGIGLGVILGSLLAVGIAFAAIKKNAKIPGAQDFSGNFSTGDSGSSGGSGGGGAMPASGTNFFKATQSGNPLPKLAKGGLIPPRKPRQVIVGDNMVEDEIVSPVSTIEKAVESVLDRRGAGGFGNDRTNQLLE